ncbi:MAG TPA: laccase domain-containing protein [Acidobacteria bacterium]|nr:laccase domain-containing protein [Acidobacteriota bacterium]
MRAGEAWQSGELAGRPVLERSWPGVRLIFSVGPRWSGDPYEERAGAVLGALGRRAAALRWCRQVHGRLLASLSGEEDRPLTGVACVGRCDGLLTADPALGVLVWTADCVPVLLHGGGVAAAVHAGWRGAAAGIVPAAVRRFEIEYGVPPADLHAALGPSIGPCHYQVGPEVLEALQRADPGDGGWRHGDRADLRALLAAQLVGAGVPAGSVERVGGCTACDPALASYRRDGERAGRQWSLALLPA